jgi:hypothetical protein
MRTLAKHRTIFLLIDSASLVQRLNMEQLKFSPNLGNDAHLYFSPLVDAIFAVWQTFDKI